MPRGTICLLSGGHHQTVQFGGGTSDPDWDVTMFTCFIRYEIAPGKLDAFRDYARAWIALIRKHGGTHHGYFLPGTNADALPDATFSFPGLGHEGPPNVGVALFSFP